jgi:uncharacterized membrane protein YpjA
MKLLQSEELISSLFLKKPHFVTFTKKLLWKKKMTVFDLANLIGDELNGFMVFLEHSMCSVFALLYYFIGRKRIHLVHDSAIPFSEIE